MRYVTTKDTFMLFTSEVIKLYSTSGHFGKTWVSNLYYSRNPSFGKVLHFEDFG